MAVKYKVCSGLAVPVAVSPERLFSLPHPGFSGRLNVKRGMTAEETIALARKEGVRLEVKKGQIAWEGPRKPSPLLLANLKFHQSALVRLLGSLLDEEDRELLRQAGLPPDAPAVLMAIRLFEGKIRAVRKAGSKGLIQRKGK